MDTSVRPRFHLALPVDDLDAAREFYGNVLGCPQGRSDTAWVDWDLRGHQVVTHLAPATPRSANSRSRTAFAGILPISTTS